MFLPSICQNIWHDYSWCRPTLRSPTCRRDTASCSSIGQLHQWQRQSPVKNNPDPASSSTAVIALSTRHHRTCQRSCQLKFTHPAFCPGGLRSWLTTACPRTSPTPLTPSHSSWYCVITCFFLTCTNFFHRWITSKIVAFFSINIFLHNNRISAT